MSNSFPFDLSSLPHITTRKALLLVDFQTDFLDPDKGALPVVEPDGYFDRAVQLAHHFRTSGDVVWINSQFEELRPVEESQIVVADEGHKSTRESSARADKRPSARRLLSLKLPTSLPLIEDGAQIDEEAFLSHSDAKCVRPSAVGSEMPVKLKQAVQKNDMVLTKSHYSAFEQTQLIRMLRGKMVTEVFVCGSLANVGVYATALDAAGHGMTITVVEDCCGYRNEARQRHAVKSLLDLTGCEFASYKEVLETLPQTTATSTNPLRDPKPEGLPAQLSATTTATASTRTSSSPDIVKPMTGLRLASNSPGISSDPFSPGNEDDAGNTNDAVSHARMSPSPSQVASAQHAPHNHAKSAVGQESDAMRQPGATSAAGHSADGRLQDDSGRTPSQAATSATRKTTNTALLLLGDPIEPARTGTMTDSGSDNDFPAAGGQRQLCSGDTDVIENVLPAALSTGVFSKLREEVKWQRMSHQGGEVPRLVAVQGLVEQDGSIPVYRHPTDESLPLVPFSETVLAIKGEIEKHLGHDLNHVLIQFYRDGNDYISEHSDKTLDIVKGSYIANVSLGAERVMVLRTKRRDKDPARASETSSSPPSTDTKRQVERARLPHNSLCRMGLKTNAEWLHAIRQDRRADREKTPAELAFKGGRISLTFRQIGTFLDKEEKMIWGQGAIGKTKKDARAVINGQTPAAINMLRAFGTENHSSTFDWDAHYGGGFDVLHISNAPRLFTSSDAVANLRVNLMLIELGVKHAKGSIVPVRVGKDDGIPQVVAEDSPPIKFVDNDEAKTVVEGDVAIMLYLNAQHGTAVDPQYVGKLYTLFQKCLQLDSNCRDIRLAESNDKANNLVKKQLHAWDRSIPQNGFLVGERPALPDLVFWPTLHTAIQQAGPDVLHGLTNVEAYYRRLAEREGVQTLVGRITGGAIVEA